jgi:hypothetical protein
MRSRFCRLCEYAVRALTDADVHRALRHIVSQIRDRHTRYSYPGNPNYSLPFMLERAFDNNDPVYMVTQSLSKEGPLGSAVVRWNGVPTEFVVREFAEDVGAGNEAARHALALVFLTRRLGTRFDPPHEQEVRLDIVRPDGSAGETRLQWSPVPPLDLATTGVTKGPPIGQGVDAALLIGWREHFKTFSMRFEQVIAQAYGNVQLRIVRRDGIDYVHLRIADFAVDDADDFARHVATLLKGTPPNRVVIDLGGNPGGYIKAADAVSYGANAQLIRR